MQQAGIRRPGLFDAGQAALTGDFSDALMRHEQRRVLQLGTRRWRGLSVCQMLCQTDEKKPRYRGCFFVYDRYHIDNV